MAKKKHAEEEHENVERWLITYADMITLLMAFFVMMYAMSVVNKGKFAALAVSVRTGFGGPIAAAIPEVLIQEHSVRKPGMVEPDDFELINLALKLLKKSITRPKGRNEKISSAEAAKRLRKLLGQMDVVARGSDMVIRLQAGPITFPRGSAELTPGAKRILDAVATLIARTDNPIRIEGHTCDLPIHTARYPSNWELSAQRAINVLTYLIHKGIEPSRLSAVGYADTMPLVPNLDEAHRRKNRRVDIVLVGALRSGVKKQLAKEFASGAAVERIDLKSPQIRPNLGAEVKPKLSAE